MTVFGRATPEQVKRDILLTAAPSGYVCTYMKIYQTQYVYEISYMILWAVIMLINTKLVHQNISIINMSKVTLISALSRRDSLTNDISKHQHQNMSCHEITHLWHATSGYATSAIWRKRRLKADTVSYADCFIWATSSRKAAVSSTCKNPRVIWALISAQGICAGSRSQINLSISQRREPVIIWLMTSPMWSGPTLSNKSLMSWNQERTAGTVLPSHDVVCFTSQLINSLWLSW